MAWKVIGRSPFFTPPLMVALSTGLKVSFEYGKRLKIYILLAVLNLQALFHIAKRSFVQFFLKKMIIAWIKCVAS